MAEETSFYSDRNGVLVTDKRLVLNSTTYTMANITSVSTYKRKPIAGPLGVLFSIFGAFILIGGIVSGNISAAIIGGVVAVIGFYCYRFSEPTFHLEITSASGEFTPLTSKDSQLVKNVAKAINEAIVRRS